VSDIQCTTDYSVVTKYLGNREDDKPPNKKRIEKIAESMIEQGFIKSYCIVVNAKMEILDGQHRFEAAKLLGIPVYFRIDDALTLKQIQTAGKLSRAWSRMDYINSYASIGNASYQRMKECIAKSAFREHCCLNILMRVYSKDVKVWTSQLQDGLIEFGPEKVATYWTIHAKIEFVVNRIPEYQNSANAIMGLLSLVMNERYDQSRMADKIAYISNRFVRRYSVREYIELFYEIYSFRTSPAHQIKPNVLACHKRKLLQG